MNIIVCIKQTPDTEARIKINKGDTTICSDGVQYVVNPYDEFAVEEALRIKEKCGGDITVISLGPERVKKAVQTCLAMGADRGIHIADHLLEGADNYIVAKVLSEKIKGLPFDLILCGKQAVDDDSSQVGQMIAEFLNIPHITVVTKVEISADQKTITAHKEIEAGIETLETPIPVMLTCQKGLNEPRLPSLRGIMSAKKKDMELLTLSSLGLNPAETGAAGSKLLITSLSLPPQRKAGKMVDEENPEASVKKLVALLREEAKVI